MNTTIIASAAERHEEAVTLAVFETPSVDRTGLTGEQLATVMALLQPELEKHNLFGEYDGLYLTYLVDGVPKLRQCWKPFEPDVPLPDAVDVLLNDGSTLWLHYSLKPQEPVFSL